MHGRDYSSKTNPYLQEKSTFLLSSTKGQYVKKSLHAWPRLLLKNKSLSPRKEHISPLFHKWSICEEISTCMAETTPEKQIPISKKRAHFSPLPQMVNMQINFHMHGRDYSSKTNPYLQEKSTILPSSTN